MVEMIYIYKICLIEFRVLSEYRKFKLVNQCYENFGGVVPKMEKFSYSKLKFLEILPCHILQK